ncbi:MAG: filamentous hemagglutinin N-terminal domain-containing protein [Methylococcaceae bacterium]|nr:MAG: filamentous hemagglutinin N-terminal domain-containing protein [Methylococcaceae bacterium]
MAIHLGLIAERNFKVSKPIQTCGALLAAASAMLRLRRRFYRLCRVLFLSPALLHPSLSSAAGGNIATDGTLGAVRSFNGANVTIPQRLGTTVGNNLFHSFARFNVGTGQTVTFTENTPGTLRNVVSRVTGNDASEIAGALKSAIPNADFYFVNPQGITFGAHAQIDVPGAFHAGTADKIAFQHDSAVFYAANNRTSSLSAAAPAAFGFLAKSAANNGLIAIDGATLAVRHHQSLDVVAGSISVGHNATLAAPGGDIRLVAKQDEGAVLLGKTDEDALPLPAAHPLPANGGDIHLESGVVTTASAAGGHIRLWGESVVIDDSRLDAGNPDTPDGAFDHAGQPGSITLRAGALQVLNGSRVSADTHSRAQAGSVSVQADSVLIDGRGSQTGIASETRGAGDAGSVSLQAGALDIRNGGGLSSSTYAGGEAGSVAVAADRVTIAGHGAQLTGIASFAAASSSGNAGTVTVTAGSLDIHDGGGISSSTWSSGDAGNVMVAADSARIDGNGGALATGIFSNANAPDSGNAGSVEVRAGTLEIRNGGRINSDTQADARAGSVTVTADRIMIDGHGIPTGIGSETKGSGKAGTVLVKAGSLDIRHGGGVSSSAYADGNAGRVSVTANDLTIAGQGVLLTGVGSFAADTGSGDAGLVSVEAGQLDIHNGGGISSSTWSTGSAGNVSVKAGSALIDGRGGPLATGIFSDASLGHSGDAGTVSLRAGHLELRDGGRLSSNTYSQGSAGTVSVDADTLMLGVDSFIGSASRGRHSSGKTGNVTVTAHDWLRLDRGKISIENEASLNGAAAIRPGSIAVTAPDIDLTDSEITTHATGNVAAGNIVIQFVHGLRLDPSYIRTTAGSGNGGSITIAGGETVYLQNSGIRTSVSGADGNGGDIRVTAANLIMASGLVQANAVGGSGGNITLSLHALIPSGSTLLRGGEQPLDWSPGAFGYNVIQAASATGISGTVNVTAPQLNLSGVLANLGGPQFDADAINQGNCESAGGGSSLIRLGEGGLPPRSGDWWMFPSKPD